MDADVGQTAVIDPVNSSVDNEPPLTKFIVFYEGHCGSSHILCSLSSHPDAIVAGEIPAGLSTKDQLDKLRQFFGEHGKQYAALGLKMKPRDLPDKQAVVQLLNHLDVRPIFLYRRNPVNWALTACIATHRFHQLGDHNRYTGMDVLPPFHIEPDVFESALKYLLLQENQLKLMQAMFEAPLVLFYESLRSDERAFFSQLLNFLNLTPMPLQSTHLPYSSDQIDLEIVNADEVKAKFIGTRFEPMFRQVER